MAELGLAIVATVDLCFKYGNSLVKICASFKGAESEIAERALCLESYWKRTSLQLDFLKRIWQSLDTEHQSIQNQILQVLISKLTIAISKLEGFLEMKSGNQQSRDQQVTVVRRWKYALLKESLDKAIEDLNVWQKMFDPSWFLILMGANAQIDAELARENGNKVQTFLGLTHSLRDALRGAENQNRGPIFRPADGLKSAQTLDIPFSSAKFAQRAGSSEWLILDSVPCPPHGDSRQLTKNVRDLARKLSQSDPIQFGLLKCSGVVKELQPSTGQPISFTFVFRTPDGFSQPQSLRASLLLGDANHSLSNRFSIAREIAKSTSFIHTFGFVHKNIRPETILTLKNRQSALGSSFLVGFEDFRTAEGKTLRLNDSIWEKDLYRHPRRQGFSLEVDYIMQHDIYSLGVCLLEVGLWESLVAYSENGTGASPSSALALPPEKLSVWDPFFIKNHLVSLAQYVLPTRMGSKYAKIVETCLTCLDENNIDFGDEREFADEDGILVGVRYIEKGGHSQF